MKIQIHIPRLPGVIHAGSAAHQVLEAFWKNEDCWLSQSNVQWLARLDVRAVDWALNYLHKLGLIEQFNADERNPRSGRYRLIPGFHRVPAKISGQDGASVA